MIRSLTRLIAALAIIVAPAVPNAAQGGANSGGGGDTVAIQFIQTANRLAEHLLFLQEDDRRGLDPRALGEAVFSVQVQSTEDKLILNGASVDAINYPSEKRILLSRSGWEKANPELRQVLVLHEYLGILGVRDDHYQVSRPVVTDRRNRVNLCEADQERFRQDTVGFFLGKGYVLENYVGNHTSTLAGSSLYAIRGYAFSKAGESAKNGSVAALYRVGECNPHTGKYDHLQFSASGAGFDACR